MLFLLLMVFDMKKIACPPLKHAKNVLAPLGSVTIQRSWKTMFYKSNYQYIYRIIHKKVVSSTILYSILPAQGRYISGLEGVEICF